MEDRTNDNSIRSLSESIGAGEADETKVRCHWRRYRIMSRLSPILVALSTLAASTAGYYFNCNYAFTSRDIAAQLANLPRDESSITFKGCDLTTFDFGSLAEFKELRDLFVDGGSLVEFRGMPYLPTLLRVLIYVANFAKFWPPGLTPSLDVVYLERLPNDMALDGVLNSIDSSYKGNLTFLWIRNTGATRVPLNIIQEFPNLYSFILNYNKNIRSLTTGSFPSRTNLIVLDLSSNNITIIEPGTFEGYFGGKGIILRDSNLASLDEAVFGSVLRSMATADSGSLYLGTVGACDCKLSWIIRDSPELLKFIRSGQCNLPPFGWLNLIDVPASFFTSCPVSVAAP